MCALSSSAVSCSCVEYPTLPMLAVHPFLGHHCSCLMIVLQERLQTRLQTRAPFIINLCHIHSYMSNMTWHMRAAWGSELLIMPRIWGESHSYYCTCLADRIKHTSITPQTEHQSGACLPSLALILPWSSLRACRQHSFLFISGVHQTPLMPS